MQRDFLKELGITDESVIDKIMNENGNDIENAKGNSESLAEQLKTLKAELSTRDSQLDELKKSAKNSDDLVSQIDKLKETNKTSIENYEAKLKQLTIDSAVELKLRDANAKNTKAVKALLDLDKITLKDDKVVGIDEQIAELIKDESSSFLFGKEEPHQTIKGAVPTPANGKNHNDGIQDFRGAISSALFKN